MPAWAKQWEDLIDFEIIPVQILRRFLVVGDAKTGVMIWFESGQSDFRAFSLRRAERTQRSDSSGARTPGG